MLMLQGLLRSAGTRGCFKGSTWQPSPPPPTMSAFASDKYVFFSPRRLWFFPLTKQKKEAPLMGTQFCWLLKWNPLPGTLQAGNGLFRNKTATYVRVCEAKRTPNISKAFHRCRYNSVYSKIHAKSQSPSCSLLSIGIPVAENSHPHQTHPVTASRSHHHVTPLPLHGQADICTPKNRLTGWRTQGLL